MSDIAILAHAVVLCGIPCGISLKGSRGPARRAPAFGFAGAAFFVPMGTSDPFARAPFRVQSLPAPCAPAAARVGTDRTSISACDGTASEAQLSVSGRQLARRAPSKEHLEDHLNAAHTVDGGVMHALYMMAFLPSTKPVEPQVQSSLRQSGGRLPISVNDGREVRGRHRMPGCPSCAGDRRCQTPDLQPTPPAKSNRTAPAPTDDAWAASGSNRKI